MKIGNISLRGKPFTLGLMSTIVFYQVGYLIYTREENVFFTSFLISLLIGVSYNFVFSRDDIYFNKNSYVYIVTAFLGNLVSYLIDIIVR
jgi:putative effector of murein hydrolase